MNFEGNWELDSFKLDFKNNHFSYAKFLERVLVEQISN